MTMASQEMSQVHLFLMIVSAESSLGDGGRQRGECSAVELLIPPVIKPRADAPPDTCPLGSASSSSIVLGRSSPCLYWALRNRLTCSRRLLEFTTISSSAVPEKVHSSVNYAVRVENLSKRNFSVKLRRQDCEGGDSEVGMGMNQHGDASSVTTDLSIGTYLRLGDFLVIADTVEVHLGAVKVITRAREAIKDANDSPLWLFNPVKSNDGVSPTPQPHLYPIEECVLTRALSWAKLPRGARMEIMRTAWWMRKSSLGVTWACSKRKAIVDAEIQHHQDEFLVRASNFSSENCTTGDDDGFSDVDAATPTNSKVNSQLVLKGAAGGATVVGMATTVPPRIPTREPKQSANVGDPIEGTPHEGFYGAGPACSAATSGSPTQDEPSGHRRGHVVCHPSPSPSHGVDLNPPPPPVHSYGETYDEKLDDALAALEDRSAVLGRSHRLFPIRPVAHLGPLVLGEAEGEGETAGRAGTATQGEGEARGGPTHREAVTAGPVTTPSPPLSGKRGRATSGGGSSRRRRGTAKRGRTGTTPRATTATPPPPLPPYANGFEGYDRVGGAHRGFPRPPAVRAGAPPNADESQEVFFRHS
ncbi:unnamed protein product [Phytomonas sp. EM1]|nr:unnamed protein product [Phytomonas sp. EM1]|eukprot:CCW60717.1 unnamed protein product [Phytomonas sp. isolate EM1]